MRDLKVWEDIYQGQKLKFNIAARIRNEEMVDEWKHIDEFVNPLLSKHTISQRALMEFMGYNNMYTFPVIVLMP